MTHVFFARMRLDLCLLKLKTPNAPKSLEFWDGQP